VRVCDPCFSRICLERAASIGNIEAQPTAACVPRSHGRSAARELNVARPPDRSGAVSRTASCPRPSARRRWSREATKTGTRAARRPRCLLHAARCTLHAARRPLLAASCPRLTPSRRAQRVGRRARHLRLSRGRGHGGRPGGGTRGDNALPAPLQRLTPAVRPGAGGRTAQAARQLEALPRAPHHAGKVLRYRASLAEAPMRWPPPNLTAAQS
jgi:hypothetical protein